ncbi:putative flavin adenine dinucleotide binding [Lyophyllum shimeji]|uniref:Flavin adenine dinucleotide binding n=1 Tax=Lyophyllum shimeji TaxID=47721 RepID=A0A9P3PKJ4_LYOSH|nr:putative flavin adenine dinucleotide binding [Lyophyllum shimeji]
MLSAKPAALWKPQFDIMKQIIETTDIPQMEFAWNVAAGENGTTNLIFDRIVLLKPFSRGFVHINSTEPLAPPVIDPKYLSAPHDKFVLAKAIEYTRTLVNKEPLKSHIDGSILPDSTVQTEEDFVDFVNTQSRSEHHFVGTAAMTPRSQGGVVDPSLIVYGTSNVRVADLSIIANIPGIHTVSVAYMVAERAAEIIKADW